MHLVCNVILKAVLFEIDSTAVDLTAHFFKSIFSVKLKTSNAPKISKFVNLQIPLTDMALGMRSFSK